MTRNGSIESYEGHARQTGDAWQHRSMAMSCETCMWFVAKDACAGRVGRCRRHAPTMAGYPVCFAVDWCGDHKLNEQALLPV